MAGDGGPAGAGRSGCWARTGPSACCGAPGRVSFLGDSLSLVALMLHVAATTGQALAVALLLLAGDFAPALLGPLARDSERPLRAAPGDDRERVCPGRPDGGAGGLVPAPAAAAGPGRAAGAGRAGVPARVQGRRPRPGRRRRAGAGQRRHRGLGRHWRDPPPAGRGGAAAVARGARGAARRRGQLPGSRPRSFD